VIGELLSGSAPPAEFFQPIGFVMLAVLYGGGAILARELTHRWNKSWPTLLVLGAAYGVAEEGLMCKSFFDPSWMDLGPLGSYGRWFGVNWVWAAELTIYHAVFSIAIPVLLVSLMFPMQRQQVWIGTKKLIFLFILWVLNAVVIFLFISPYRPPAFHYVTAVAVTIGLCMLARWLPHLRAVCEQHSKKIAHPFWFLLAGFLGTLALFFLVWGGASYRDSSIIDNGFNGVLSYSRWLDCVEAVGQWRLDAEASVGTIIGSSWLFYSFRSAPGI